MMHFPVYLRPDDFMKRPTLLHLAIQSDCSNLYDFKWELFQLLFLFFIALVPFQVQYDIIHSHLYFFHQLLFQFLRHLLHAARFKGQLQPHLRYHIGEEI